MPYIKVEDRVDIIDALASVIANGPGELNFIITYLCNRNHSRLT